MLVSDLRPIDTAQILTAGSESFGSKIVSSRWRRSIRDELVVIRKGARVKRNVYEFVNGSQPTIRLLLGFVSPPNRAYQATPGRWMARFRRLVF